MALIPLAIPPGVHRNGTDFENSNLWRDANLVRWQQQSLRPVGGWVLRLKSIQAANSAYGMGLYGSGYYGGQLALNQPPRAMFAWADNNDFGRIAVGMAEGLYVIEQDGDAYNITPPGLGVGYVDAAANTAYGGNFFGTGYFGVKRPSSGRLIEATTWSLDNWGEYLIACASTDGVIYEWQLNTGTDPAALANAPVDNKAAFVTEERFVFALGAGGNPRKVQWCDREDNTLWTPAATNEAGDIELQTQGQIMCGIRMRGRSLILTTEDAHIATYQGPPYVYGFERAGTHCGTASRKSLVAVDEGAFWMGRDAFFVFNGSSVQPVTCQVRDYIFDDINRDQISKVYGVVNSRHHEIWWFYPSGSSIENDRYVVFDYMENHWTVGKIVRTAGVDQGVFNSPIWAYSNGDLYEHETGNVFNIEAAGITHTAYAETAPISLGNGDSVMKVNNLIPDESTQGDVEVSFETRFHPNDTARTYGPYSMSNPTSVRFTGRQIRMKVEGVRNTNWRAGIMRVEATPGGRR